MKPRDELSDFLKQADVAKEQATSLKARLRAVSKERDTLQRQLDLIEMFKDAPRPERPRWLTAKPTKEHRATLCLLVTDTHFEEEVDPSEIDGLNAYNREIAELRLARAFKDSIKLARHYLAGVKYDGALLML